MKCIECRKKIGILDETCPYCGAEQYDDQPVQEPVINKMKRESKESLFSDEEILALGLYPNDEGYRMSIISQITGKR